MAKEKPDTLRKKKVCRPTPSVTNISVPVEDRKLLKHLSQVSRLNVKGYSSNNKIPRSTIYDSVKRLERMRFLINDYAMIRISDKGKIYLENTNQIEKEDVGGVRKECRDNGNLSSHFHKFTMKILDRSKFRIERLDRLNHYGYKELKLANLHQIIVTFGDAKVVINPKQISINLYDIVKNNVKEVDAECLARAVEYAQLLKSIGIITEGIMVEKAHWARIESILSEFLCEKVDEKYFLKLDDGSQFWIDNSPDEKGTPRKEDETDSKLVRERVDVFLNQVAANDFDLKDINKIKDSLGFITKLETARLTDKIEENKLKRTQAENKIPEYKPEIGYIPSYLK